MIRVIYDTNRLNQILLEIRARIGDLRPALRRIAGDMMDSTEENFAQEGRPRWPDLADSTKKARARKGKWPGKMLQVSGSLASSITSRVTEDSAIVGTNKAYAARKQFGFKGTESVKSYTRRDGTSVKGHSRQADEDPRPFLNLTKSDVAQAEKTLLNYLMRLPT